MVYISITSNGDKPMAKRTFKQLKEDATLKAGALWQEECEDGTQPYSMITPESFKSTGESSYSIDTRSLVEDNPTWFVEVFKVEPEYMTQEELDRYHTFLSGKPAQTQKPTKAFESIIPERRGRPTKYNFEDMAVGDTRTISASKAKSAYTAAYKWTHMYYPHRKFSVRKGLGNTYVIRRER